MAAIAGAPSDGSAWMNAGNGDCSRAVLRGGSWLRFIQRSLRSAEPRLVPSAASGSDVIGFRVVRTLRER